MDNQRGCRSRIPPVIVVLLVLSWLFSSVTAFAQTGAPPSAEPAAVPTSPEQTTKPLVALSPEERQKREEWQKAMSQVPLPKKGCFNAAYPSMQWQEVPCTTAPPYPQPPRRGRRPLTVGNGNDDSPQVPTGFISTAIGSFDSVTGVTSESGPIGNAGPAVANAYTLQLNTDFFVSTACAASPNSGCRGWQQFVFENNGSAGKAYIQYWLYKYNTTCPAGVGWNQFSFTGSTDIYCYKNNSLGAASVPAQPITNLGQLSLTGTVSAGGDSVTLSTGSNVYSVAGDNAVNAAAGWRIAEFNVFADGGNSAGGGQASFNSGSTVVPRTRVIYGGSAPPVCVTQGFTGETNNLSFGPSAPPASQPGPALIFTESSAGGSPSNCAAGTTVGDTHLTTFGGLLYDFQATGDFLVAETGPDFVVQARQVSGAPTWPNASLNKAVAVRTGRSRVAICLAPTRVEIDGRPVHLREGRLLELPDGGDVVLRGNVYVVRGPSGDSVRAVINNTYIDVSVGLGRWPSNVRGLLANGGKGINSIETRDGEVLTSPLSYEALYGRYADSWRVPSNESMLSACGREVERGIPKKPFFAKDLNPEVARRTRAICAQTGVKEGPLMDACTLDVAVIGRRTAAKVFAAMPRPIAVGDANSR